MKCGINPDKDLLVSPIQPLISKAGTGILLFVLLLLSSFLSAQPESWYIGQISVKLNGQTEVPVENGRVDIVTDKYAIEVERAANWKHAVGQCLWYALQTNKQPGIALIMTSIDDRRHGIRLQSTLDYAGLGEKVKVWFYPEDFDSSFDDVVKEFDQGKQKDPKATGYWLSTNSGVRHNSRCRWYTNSKGRYCKMSEGRACSVCGG